MRLDKHTGWSGIHGVKRGEKKVLLTEHRTYTLLPQSEHTAKQHVLPCGLPFRELCVSVCEQGTFGLRVTGRVLQESLAALTQSHWMVLDAKEVQSRPRCVESVE